MRCSVITVAVFMSAVSGWAQSPTCQATAVPPLLRSAGVTERIGDIVLKCTGPVNREVTGALTVSLVGVPVTNRISGADLDVVAAVDHGAGASILPVTARLQLANQVVFDTFTFNLGPAGSAEVRISNIRADVSQRSTGIREVTAQLAFNPPSLLNFTTTNLTVGFVNRGLFGTSLLGLVASQVGSPVPESLTFDAFIAKGTAFSSTRLTEGFNSAFEKRGPGMDHGVRIMLRYSGLTSDSRLFVPAAVAGSNALRPTSAGDFGDPVSRGEYAPGTNSLLLTRVINADQNGIGGFPAVLPLGAPTVLNEMTEVSIDNGTATVVYEVYDTNPSLIESVQIPTFLGGARSEMARSVTVVRQIFFSPLSTVGAASPFAPIPRFVPEALTSDCELRGDCQSVQPRLVINSALLDFEATQGLPYVRREVIFSNAGGGLMPWTARVEYRTGSGWVELAPQSGLRPVALGVQLVLTNLQPGDYEATLVIDAGDAGISRLPIRLRLNPRPAPSPTVTSIGNAATFQGALVAGSLATIKGSNLAGSNVSLTLNNRPARLLFTSSDQINFAVPSDLTGTAAQLVVTANGVAGSPMTVNVAQTNPGIFVPGILNQDFTVNSASNPARAGTFVQIYATGLLPPSGQGEVEAKLHDLILTSLPYAGPAPGIAGVQQVNLQIPPHYPTMTTEVLLCSTVNGQRACSPPVKISVMAAQ